ncbi:MAG: FAD-binding oxidoreductase [Actinomycetes bacterium]
MTDVATVDVDVLRNEISGEVLVAGDRGYDQARTVWNGAIDLRPRIIVRCASAGDVGAAIGFARAHDLEIAVRGGAHSTGGNSVVQDGLQIDLSLMKDVTVDAVARRCTVGGGATLADRDTATQVHGLATTAGIVGHTGVGGLTLGGGMGWLTRKYGLAVDSLVSAEVVTADGRVRHTSPDEEPDLYWAIRGGSSNFGVVTRFDFQLHPVAPMVQFGLFFWPLEQSAEVLRLARDVISTLAPDLNVIIGGVSAPPAPFVPEEHHHRPGCALLLTGFGTAAEHEAVVARIRTDLPPLVDLVTPMPYVQLQQMFDEDMAFGLLAYDKAIYVEELSPQVISVVTEHLPRKTSPRSAMFVYRLDGAYSEVGDDDTAFGGGRSPRFCLFLIALADNQGMLDADRGWVRAFWDALVPHAMGIGSYINGETEFPDDRVRSSYGEAKYQRLARIKAVYDPDNVFHRNANIRPAPQPPQQRASEG